MMKKYLVSLVLMLSLVISIAWADEVARPVVDSCPAVLSHQLDMLDGPAKNLCDFKGNVLLVVNTASSCGFTPQFEALESLYQSYKDQGLIILGVPSNSFFQERKEGQDILEFCRLNYGVTFPMARKTPVKGDNAHPLYKSLADETGQWPKWNFFKYLIDRDGQVVSVFNSTTKPDDAELVQAVEQAIKGE